MQMELFPVSVEPETIIPAVDSALTRLVDRGVSDLHLEPQTTGYLFRMRKDGLFLEGGRSSAEAGARVIGRLKVMARLAAYRTDIPQEGALALPAGRGHGRLSVVPTVNGEKAVLRFLVGTDVELELDKLGFDNDILSGFRRLLGSPQGLILVVGPSGSGKTTTLYASVMEIHRHQGTHRSIATLEDPVERNLGTLAQTEVNPERGLSFPAGLKALLRQDPEVLLIGEIRDADTARVAVQAGLTGHLVLSSMHTADCFEAITRLTDLSVEPGLAAGALRGILAQRLIPLTCERPERDCPDCHGTGLSGRQAVGELLTLNDTLHAAIARGGGKSALACVARDAGHVDLATRAHALVRAGRTRLELVQQMLGGEA
jgi:general secretion pathway protein E